MLGSAELAEEVSLDGSGKLVKVGVREGGSGGGAAPHRLLPPTQITGCSSPGRTVSIVVRGSNKLVMEEAERSIHDALCVIRCLVKKRWVVSAETPAPPAKALLQERYNQRESRR